MLIPVNIIRNSPFSVPAVITTSAGAVTVRGIFSDDASSEEFQAFDFYVENPVLTFIDADKPGVDIDDSVSANGKNYKVRTVKRLTSIGVTYLELVSA
jgi:hypothetical protein